MINLEPSIGWDEPTGATTPRGWYIREGVPRGFYLAYGPDHYRSGHHVNIGGGRIVSFCTPDKLCRECQPGDVLCVRYPDGPGSDEGKTSRYVETIAEARCWVAHGEI